MEYKMRDSRGIVHRCAWDRESVMRDDQYEGWLYISMKCGKKLKFHQDKLNRLADTRINCLGCI